MNSGATRTILLMGLIGAAYSLRAQVPDWALTHNHKGYPPQQFILGVGSGTGAGGEESAKRLAQSDVAAQVRVKVQSEVKNVQQTFGLNQNEEAYADFKIRSTSVVDEMLTGAEIVETAVDTVMHTTYALAALNKEKFASSIEAELTGGWGEAAELRIQAEKFFRRGNLTEAIQNLMQARTSVAALLPKEALHDAIAAAPLRADPALGPSALSSSIRDYLGRVRVEKISGDHQTGKLGAYFAEPFKVKVAEVVDQSQVPVVGATVSFIGSSGVILGEAVTDAGGFALLAIKARGSVGSSIRARISMKELNKEFASNLTSLSKTFSCEVLNADVAFALKIEAPSSSLENTLHTIVQAAVTRTGYQLVDMSGFIVKVLFNARPAATIDGMGGPLYDVSSDVSILLINSASAATIGSILVTTKGVAKSRDAAVKKSAENLVVNDDALSSLLEKARN